ncbi:hypothetical protein BDK92_6588 [Micromonospora pisi]|uniref:ABC-2 family transporter n=1 Tax=Micromonospora pisi TaxID=589240 RepID=A0A495JUX0_9ACTN|nr:ABC transporter permease subunit [Micromonospora pisi]RKR92154.1 hypothetical protein BDK92_6588 [Micromonospora pisi]
MIWLTWRQFRAQALTASGVLAALAVYLLFLGLAIRNSHADLTDCPNVAGCSINVAMSDFKHQYSPFLGLTGALLIAVPAIIGTFWGAPLITRELETGTHRLVWNQSVTRTYWLAVKLVIVALASAVVTGALSLLLTWAASPYDALLGDRFNAFSFATRNIAPLGYAVFAFILGTTVGLIVRRTLPAMAITLAVFATFQILVPAVVRPHVIPPVTEQVAFTTEALQQADGLGISDGAVQLVGYTVPGAWVLSNTILRNAAGERISRGDLEDCMRGNLRRDAECLEAKNLHFTVSYQPADRYWTFQWLELAVFLLLAGLLAGFAFWRIPRGVN